MKVKTNHKDRRQRGAQRTSAEPDVEAMLLASQREREALLRTIADLTHQKHGLLEQARRLETELRRSENELARQRERSDRLEREVRRLDGNVPSASQSLPRANPPGGGLPAQVRAFFDDKLQEGAFADAG